MTPAQDDLDTLTLPEQEAFSLTHAALLLDQARCSAQRSHELASALNHNLEIWVAIRALAQDPANALPEAVRGNLVRLSDFVAQTTFTQGAAICDSSVNTLININLQLSEGLLEGPNAAVAS